jgi:hypothetical protein
MTEVLAAQFKKCSRCGAVRYCTRACQVAHWKAGHKRECGGGGGGGGSGGAAAHAP